MSVLNGSQLQWTKLSVNDHYHNNTVNKTFKNATRSSSTIVKNNIFGYYIYNCNVNKKLHGDCHFITDMAWSKKIRIQWHLLF